MVSISNKTFDAERALYGSDGVTLNNCVFDGIADGESALKESQNIVVSDSFFNLRYPFWHDDNLKISGCELTANCRAALWYSKHICISNTKLHGIKALRECEDVSITSSSIISPEFGWSVKNASMSSTSAESEYFMMRSSGLSFDRVTLKGKYSFQYISNSVFTDCVFDTKDAFWHAENVTVKNSVIKGEYFSWYSDGLTLVNCKIIGTQPLCYCKNLRLINCEMENADLCFEKSQVEATVISDVISIKNPLSGKISVKSVGEIIRDDVNSKGEIVIL